MARLECYSGSELQAIWTMSAGAVRASRALGTPHANELVDERQPVPTMVKPVAASAEFGYCRFPSADPWRLASASGVRPQLTFLFIVSHECRAY